MHRDDVEGMRRRTFLKLLGAAGVVAALPASEILMPAPEAVEAAHASAKLVSGDVAIKVGDVWTRVGQLIDFTNYEHSPLLDVSSFFNSPYAEYRSGIPQHRLAMNIVPAEHGHALCQDCMTNFEPAPLRIVMGDQQFTADDFRMTMLDIHIGHPFIYEVELDPRVRHVRRRRPEAGQMTFNIEGRTGQGIVVELV